MDTQGAFTFAGKQESHKNFISSAQSRISLQRHEAHNVFKKNECKKEQEQKMGFVLQHSPVIKTSALWLSSVEAFIGSIFKRYFYFHIGLPAGSLSYLFWFLCSLLLVF